MERRNFLKNAGMASGLLLTAPLFGNMKFSESKDFPVIDMHVHTTDTFTIDRLMEISEKRKVKFGVLDHPAVWAIKDDADLKKYIDKLKGYPVYIGLQPINTGWSKNFSPDLLKELDYVLMDAQTIPIPNGEDLRIWEFDTYVDNTEVFMERYMEHTLNILHNEPIQIFGWPLFLPVCIARDYYSIWTEKRMRQILTAAKEKNIAIEINDMSHTPHERFIYMAKEQGLKFTFGSDSRNNNAGRLDYCKPIAKKCGLREEDFFIPARKI